MPARDRCRPRGYIEVWKASEPPAQPAQQDQPTQTRRRGNPAPTSQQALQRGERTAVEDAR